MRRQQSGHVVNINASQQASLWQASRQVLQSWRKVVWSLSHAHWRLNSQARVSDSTRLRPVSSALRWIPLTRTIFWSNWALFKRLARVEEVADLLLYLDSAQFVNGEMVHLDGGAHAGKW